MARSPRIVQPVRPSSIIDGVDRAVATALEAAGLARDLHGVTPDDGLALVDAVHGTIVANYGRQGSTANKDRSWENWRWRRPQLAIAPHNKSQEVIIEKAIVAASERLGRQDWANQVPVSSGLVTGRPDARRAIDLVRRRGERRFELIEMKIAGGSPLCAATQVLGFACLWLIARRDPPSRVSALLEADHIDLRVLAPAGYYLGFPRLGAAAALDGGVRQLGARHGVTLSFGFDILDGRIRSASIPHDVLLLEALDSSDGVAAAA